MLAPCVSRLLRGETQGGRPDELEIFPVSPRPVPFPCAVRFQRRGRAGRGVERIDRDRGANMEGRGRKAELDTAHTHKKKWGSTRGGKCQTAGRPRSDRLAKTYPDQPNESR